MDGFMDFRTLVIAFTAMRLLQAAGLLYVWHFHRRYRPAAEWAIGSALVAVGSLLIASRSFLPFHVSSLGGNFFLLIGALIFNFGIIRSSGRALPVRSGCAVVAAAMLGFAWYSVVEPWLYARIIVFGAAIVLLDTYAAAVTWNSRRGALRTTQRIIAALLALEAGVTVFRSITFGSETTSVLESSAPQIIFILVGMLVTFVGALALAVLTGWIDAAKYKAAEVREISRSHTMRLIASGAPLSTILAAIVRGVETENPAMLCSVLLRDDRNLTLRIGAAPSLPEFYNAAIQDLPIGADVGSCGAAAFSGHRVITEDITKDSRWLPYRDLAASAGLAACWSEPIVDAAGKVLGTFGIYHRYPHAPSKADIATLMEAVQLAEFAIGRSRAERALNDQLLVTRQLLSKSETTSQMLDSALDNMSQGLAMFDKDQKLIVCNEKYRNLYNLAAEFGTPGTPLSDILKARIANGYYSGNSPFEYLHSRTGFGSAAEVTNKEALEHLSDGRAIRVSRRSIPTGGWVTTHEDVTELHRNEARIAFMAHHDALTGLSNRSHFKEKIEEARVRLADEGICFSILMLDLDRFKKINDSLGHRAGDSLLKDVAARLRSATENIGIVARLGGDEFAILQTSSFGLSQGRMTAQDHQADTTHLAKHILGLFKDPFDLDGHTVSACTSIGMTLASDNGDDFESLLKKADLALYAAKSRGRNSYCLFDVEMMAVSDARNELEADLRLALKRNELEIYYQPIVDRSRSTVGVEALLRWRHPQRGLIAPNIFIPVAEDTGLIVEIGAWVLHQACKDARSWPDHITVSVNLSAVQFSRPGLFKTIESALETSGLTSHRLEVEVTESVLLDSEIDYVTLLHKIKSIGVSIALDDFGTGYSSLSYLKQFPFDRIKIDRSFTEDVAEQTNSLAIVGAVIGLARALDIVTTAEGIETEEQFEIMKIAGVTMAQGYLFGRPCPKTELRFDEESRMPPQRTLIPVRFGTETSYPGNRIRSK